MEGRFDVFLVDVNELKREKHCEVRRNVVYMTFSHRDQCFPLTSLSVLWFRNDTSNETLVLIQVSMYQCLQMD